MRCSRRPRSTVISVLILTCVVTLTVHFTELLQTVYQQIQETKGAAGGSKIILLWNNISRGYYPEKWKYADRRGFQESGCRVTDCQIVRNRQIFNRADAILFYIPTLKDKPKILKKGQRNQKQRWVYVNNESPCAGYGDEYIKDWNGLFNWTMTHRLNSDIPMLYGQYCKREKRVTLNFDRLIADKTKFAFIYMSTCADQYNGKRTTYIKLLQTLARPYRIDVFGKCAGRTDPCPRGHLDHECIAELARKYKFYLSFETSFATDYVTENLYDILPLKIVPVVRGGARYNNESVVPPHSVIHTSDFKSPSELVTYLKRVHGNKALYLKFLLWKKQYRAVYLDEPNSMRCSMIEHSFCKLCAALHEDKQSKVYPSIGEWWKPHCYSVTDFDYS